MGAEKTDKKLIVVTLIRVRLRRNYINIQNRQRQLFYLNPGTKIIYPDPKRFLFYIYFYVCVCVCKFMKK